MRLKLAPRLDAAILLASASVMMSGLLSYAVAQEGDRPVVTLPRGTGTPTGDDSASKVAPFRTGLEETDSSASPPGARVAFNLEDEIGRAHV